MTPAPHTTVPQRAPRKRFRLGLPLWVGLFFVVALVFVAYFAVNASATSAQLEDRINRELPPGIVTFDRFEFEPQTNTLHVFDLLLRGIDGIPMVRAGHVEVTLHWPDLSLSPPVSLLFRRVRISDFELNLLWNDQGDFNFTEGFGFKSKGLVRPVPKPKPLLVFDGIELSRGTVRLGFPDWGFVAENVSAQGRVEISREGLFIEADLQSHGGHAHSRGLAAQAETLATLPNAVRVEGAGSLPLDFLNIGGFVWHKQSFRASMVDIGLAGAHIAVSPALNFAPPTTSRYLAHIQIPETLASPLSGGILNGKIVAHALLDHVGLSLRVLVDFLKIDHIQLGPLSAQNLHYEAFSQQKDDILDLVFRLQLGSVKLGDHSIDNLTTTATAMAQWTAFQVRDLIDMFGKPPLEAIAALMDRRDATIDIGMTELHIGMAVANTWRITDLDLRGARAQYGDGGKLLLHLAGSAKGFSQHGQWIDSPTVDLRLSVPYPNVELSRLSLAWDGGSVEFSGYLRPEIGLLNRKAPYEITGSVTELPLALVTPPLGNTDTDGAPQTPTETSYITGTMTIGGDLLKKRSLALRSSTLTLRTPDDATFPLVPATDTAQTPDVRLGPLHWSIEAPQ